MIQIQNLIKAYNKEIVLNIPELTIEKGEIFGLVGNNGAGKTTMFNIVLDLITASKGQVISKGINVRESEDWKDFTGAFIDETFLIGYLTAEEYFGFIAGLRRLSKADTSAFLEGFSDFFNGEIIGKKKFIRDFSKGNQKKVGIVAALMGKPEVIVLDEPFANLDPSSQYKPAETDQGLCSSKRFYLPDFRPHLGKYSRCLYPSDYPRERQDCS